MSCEAFLAAFRQFDMLTGIYATRGARGNAAAEFCYARGEKTEPFGARPCHSLGVPLGKPGTPIPQPAPPACAAVGQRRSRADRRRAAGSGGGTASASGGGTGAAVAGATPTLVVACDGDHDRGGRDAARRSPRPPPGHAFGPPADDSRRRQRQLRRPAPAQWRLADVLAAIGGGPRAATLIAAANRPGPVAARQPARGAQGALARRRALPDFADGLTALDRPASAAPALTVS